jgi:anthranilate phosphoribosyltransferase
VVLNAAAALIVSGVCKDMTEGVRKAEEAIDTGKAKNTLETLIKISKE